MSEPQDSGKDRGEWPTDQLPERWTWIPFDRAFRNETTSDRKLAQRSYDSDGSLAVVDQGQSQIAGYTSDESLKHPAALPVIVFGDHTRCVKFVDFPFVQGADGVKVLSPREGLDARFAFHSLRALTLPDKGYARHYKFLTASQFPLPPLDEQRRIVAKLETLQASSRRARAALDAVPPLLEKLRQSILAAAFRGDLTKDWRAKNKNVEPANELLKRIRIERRKKWEETELAKLKAKSKPPADDRWKAKYKEPEPVDTEGLPELPEGWAWATFEQVADVDLGRQRAPQYQTGRFDRPYLRVANIKDGRIDFSDVLVMDFDSDDFDHYQLRAGDVLLSEGQSPELVGQSAIYRGEVAGLCFQKTLHRFRPFSSGPSPDYSQMLFRHYVRSGVFRSIASLTTNIAHLTLVRLKPLHFPVPPKAEEQELVRRVDEALARVSVLDATARELRALRGSLDSALLAKAFRGELVTQKATNPRSSTTVNNARIA